MFHMTRLLQKGIALRSIIAQTCCKYKNELRGDTFNFKLKEG